VGGPRGGPVIPASPKGDSKAAANRHERPPNCWWNQEETADVPASPPGGVKQRPAGAASHSPRLHHPGIQFNQPAMKSPRIYRSGGKFSLMEAATRQHPYKTASKPRQRLQLSLPPGGTGGELRHELCSTAAATSREFITFPSLTARNCIPTGVLDMEQSGTSPLGRGPALCALIPSPEGQPNLSWSEQT